MAWSRSGAREAQGCLGLHQGRAVAASLCSCAPQDLQQVMVSGPNLNETSIVSGGYGGTAEGIIPTGTIKGTGAALGGSGAIVGQRGSAPLSAPDSWHRAVPGCLLGGSGSVRGQRVGLCTETEQGLLPELPSPWAGWLPCHRVGSLLGISIPLIRTSLWDSESLLCWRIPGLSRSLCSGSSGVCWG